MAIAVRIIWLLVALAASFAAPAAPANDELFRFTEHAGPYSLGLKVVEQYDYSRIYRPSTDAFGQPYRGERARPIQTLIWYPAATSRRQPLTVGDYLGLWVTETSFDHPKMPAEAKEWLSAIKPTLSMTLWAVRDAPRAAGRFPVIIYAPSFSKMSWENADLCEYWASHGYVVLAGPSMGATSRNMTKDRQGIDTQARDISFLVGYAQSLPDVNPTDVAVAGYSWGGISNLFAAARDDRIHALVALDGNLRYSPGFVKQAEDVHPEQLAIPLISFSQGDLTIEELAQYHSAGYLTESETNGPNVLNAWIHGDLVAVHMLGLAHMEFAAMGQRNEDWWKLFPKVQRADYGREDGIAGYAWIARYTLAFLDAYLKRDAAAMAYLKKTPAANGVPPHFITVSFRAAAGIPPSLDGFRAEIGREGFSHAADIYASIVKGNSDFKLEQVVVNSWSAELIDAGHLADAIALLRLNVHIYPDSSAARESLADAYTNSGDKQLAIDNYKISLEKDAANLAAKTKLEELQGNAKSPR